MDRQVILLVERILAKRSCTAPPLFSISAALSRRRRDGAGAGPASSCNEAIASGPFVGPYRSRSDADGRVRNATRGIVTNFISAKQKSAMGLA